MAEENKLHVWGGDGGGLILFDHILSASCYKVRLLASLLEIHIELKSVNFYPEKEHKSKAFLELNPSGTIPVLRDGNKVLTNSNDILRHLATIKDKDWLGSRNSDHVELWLRKANSLNESLGIARLHDVLSQTADISKVRQEGKNLLRELELHLSLQRHDNFTFIAGPKPTIADIACFPNVALAPDGGVSIDKYPSIRLWSRAIRYLPNFIEMPGIHRAHELR